MSAPHKQSLRARGLSLAAIGLAALAVSACSRTGSVDMTASIPREVRDRHPIVLSEAPRSIEIYAGGPVLDQRQAEDLAAFAADYRANGRSHIIAEVPSGHGPRALHQVREALARNGVSSGLVQVRSYPAEHYSVASPIRLSFAKLQARVPHECGQWPHDLGVSNPRFSATNQPHWNLGCASQSNLALMVADPLDLQRPREEGRIDTTRRMRNIEKLREGQDPSTGYRDGATRINSSVGN